MNIPEWRLLLSVVSCLRTRGSLRGDTLVDVIGDVVLSVSGDGQDPGEETAALNALGTLSHRAMGI